MRLYEQHYKKNKRKSGPDFNFSRFGAGGASDKFLFYKFKFII